MIDSSVRNKESPIGEAARQPGLEDKVQKDNAGREEDAYLVVFGREFQSAGFKWLKKDFCSQTVNG